MWSIRAGTALMAHVLSADYNVLTDPQLMAGGITPYLMRAFAGESVSFVLPPGPQQLFSRQCKVQ